MLAPIDFKLSVEEPVDYCVSVLEAKNESRLLGPSHHIKVELVNEGVYKFTITQPRRMIEINAVGYLNSINQTSTSITGKISASYAFFALAFIIGILIIGYAMLIGGSGGICFGSFAIVILLVGGTTELISQYYAKLSLFTFIKRSFYPTANVA